jgi:hypothetical protein
MEIQRSSKFTSLKDVSTLPEYEQCLDALQIPKDEANNIRVFDEDKEKGLYLLHYIEPVGRSASVRGTIVRYIPSLKVGEAGNYVLISAPFPYTPEVEIIDFENNEELQSKITPAKTTFSNAPEGTIIRIFWASGWRVATYRKLNGLSSRWAGPRFGDLLYDLWPGMITSGDEEVASGSERVSSSDDIVPSSGNENVSCCSDIASSSSEKILPNGDKKISTMRSVLSKSRVYTFLMSHPKNRIVCHCDRKLILVNVSEVGSGAWCSPSEYANNPHFEISSPLFFESTQRLIEYAKSMKPYETTGLLCTGAGICIKIIPYGYSDLRDLRGNEPVIEIRYLQLDTEGRARLRDLFPEKNVSFDNVEKNTTRLLGYITSCYYTRFVQRKFERFPPEVHYLITLASQQSGDSTPEDRIKCVLQDCNARRIYNLFKYLR